MEVLAICRFAMQSEHVPWNMRENIAMSALESKRLKPNFRGLSLKGVPFFTNELGFRCSEERFGVLPKDSILLGGDSCTFGMYHPYEESWPYFFEKALLGSGDPRQVLVQAIPGGGPYMTLDHLFGEDDLAARIPTKFLFHSVSHYDHVDNTTYAEDKEDLANPKRHRLRWLKVKVSPYFFNMLQLKIRHFMRKDERRQLLLAADYSVAGKRALMRWVLKEMKNHCEQRDWKFAIFFMPEQHEVMASGTEHLAHLVEMTSELKIPFFNLERALEEDKKVELERLYRDDRLHLNAYGAKVVGQKCFDFVRSQGF
jgi:hypothetical protein